MPAGGQPYLPVDPNHPRLAAGQLIAQQLQGLRERRERQLQNFIQREAQRRTAMSEVAQAENMRQQKIQDSEDMLKRETAARIAVTERESELRAEEAATAREERATAARDLEKERQRGRNELLVLRAKARHALAPNATDAERLAAFKALNASRDSLVGFADPAMEAEFQALQRRVSGMAGESLGGADNGELGDDDGLLELFGPAFR